MILPDFIAHYFGSDKGDRTLTMYRDGKHVTQWHRFSGQLLAYGATQE